MGKKSVDPKTMFKGKIPKRNPVTEPHDPRVGSRVCVACLMIAAGKSRLRKPPHTLIAGICQAPGKIRYEPGEEAYLAEQRRLDKHVPF